MDTANASVSGLKRSVVNAHILLSSARDEIQIIRNILARCPLESGIALTVGSRYHLAAFGVWGFALANSATVGEAIQLSLAHSAMTFAFSHLSIQEHGELFHWHFDDPDLPEDLKTFSVERDMVALSMVAHDLLGSDFEATAICFNYPEPPHSDLYRKYFNGPLRFSAPRSGFVLPRSLLGMPLKVPDEVLKEAETSGFRSDTPGIRGRVRDTLLTNLKTLPSMESVAGKLCMTVRTLRRKLSSEGTTFRQLVDEVRCERAKELLEHTTMSNDDIARHLSYSDASSFSQAFRRLAGASPAAYREAKRQTH